MKKELSFYECRHGLGYSTFTGERGGIRVAELAFVPNGTSAEVHRLKISNQTFMQTEF